MMEGLVEEEFGRSYSDPDDQQAISMLVRMKPPVSVCIPTYNGAKYLHNCIQSVLEQTFKDFEVLLVDDASSDDTVRLHRTMSAVIPASVCTTILEI